MRRPPSFQIPVWGTDIGNEKPAITMQSTRHITDVMPLTKDTLGRVNANDKRRANDAARAALKAKEAGVDRVTVAIAIVDSLVQHPSNPPRVLLSGRGSSRVKAHQRPNQGSSAVKASSVVVVVVAVEVLLLLLSSSRSSSSGGSRLISRQGSSTVKALISGQGSTTVKAQELRSPGGPSNRMCRTRIRTGRGGPHSPWFAFGAGAGDKHLFADASHDEFCCLLGRVNQCQ